MLISTKCPNCGSIMNIDNNCQRFFCSYCGYQIVNVAENVTVSGSVSIDNSSQVQSLIQRALEYENVSDYAKAVEYYDRALDLDYSNTFAKDRYNYLRSLKQWPNARVIFNSSANNNSVLNVRYGSYELNIANGTLGALTLTEFENQLVFKGNARKKYKKNVYILPDTYLLSIYVTENSNGSLSFEIV